MRMWTTWVGGALLAFALAGGAGRLAVAAQTHDHDTRPAPSAAGQDAARMHAEMMSAMHARENKLAALVKTMDGATGDAKIETMAAIIRELVQNEREMHTAMGEMHEHMATPPR